MATSELIIEQLQIGPMQNFIYVVGSRATREVVMVDPAWDIDALTSICEKRLHAQRRARDPLSPGSHRGGSFGGNRSRASPNHRPKLPVKVYAHSAEADGVKR